MSQPFPDDEICTYSLNLAKELVSQAIINFVDDADERLDTDVPTHSFTNDSLIADKPYNPKFDSFAVRINRSEFSEAKDALEIVQAEIVISQEQENVTEIESQKSIEEEDLDVIDEDIEVGEIHVSDPVSKMEGTISNIFDRPAHAESSMLPFSFLGSEIEAVLQKFSKDGYLLKKSSNVFLGWQKRYFEVRGFKIYYSKTRESLREQKEVRCINLFVNPCEITEVKGQSFKLTIEGIKKKLRLKATCLAEAKQWTDFFEATFQFVTDNSAKMSRYITRKREKLLKIDVLTEEEFLEKVETGDILLFKSIHMAAKLQRTFTSSKYDHVGIVVRAFDDIYLYDSVYNGGVQLTNWKDFKHQEYYKDYMRIAYRKLEIKDPTLKAQIQENLFKFVTEHTGKKYELSLKKLLRRNSTVQPGQNNGNQPVNASNNQEGFFCSELVAAAYKSVGLLNPFVASTRYLPVSFSQKKGMKLLRDAKLSNEYSLVLKDSKFRIE